VKLSKIFKNSRERGKELVTHVEESVATTSKSPSDEELAMLLPENEGLQEKVVRNFAERAADSYPATAAERSAPLREPCGALVLESKNLKFEYLNTSAGQLVKLYARDGVGGDWFELDEITTGLHISMSEEDSIPEIHLSLKLY